MIAYKNVDDYISSFPPEKQLLLEKMRATIRKASPAAEEMISYGMPAYKLHGPLVYFGAAKNHIGLYHASAGMEIFSKDLEKYKTSKGAIQFPLDQKLPVALIEKIVRFRVKENKAKWVEKKVVSSK